MSLISASLFSSEVCFENQNEGVYQKLPAKVCLADINVSLRPFADSLITFTHEGVVKSAVIKNNVAEYLENGDYLIMPEIIKKRISKGACEEEFGYKLFLTLKVNKDGEVLSIDKLVGSEYYTFDWCHSAYGMRQFDFIKL